MRVAIGLLLLGRGAEHLGDGRVRDGGRGRELHLLRLHPSDRLCRHRVVRVVRPADHQGGGRGGPGGGHVQHLLDGRHRERALQAADRGEPDGLHPRVRAHRRMRGLPAASFRQGPLRRPARGAFGVRAVCEGLRRAHSADGRGLLPCASDARRRGGQLRRGKARRHRREAQGDAAEGGSRFHAQARGGAGQGRPGACARADAGGRQPHYHNRERLRRDRR
mmetsp:Transcript_29263/g.73491  ORF Transcript_29263/g.73491 Transcript_29263/m.73491 type:complete len:221 (-) Transcript_29263:13-675(-)